MSDGTTPMGPGFFIFFQNPVVAPLAITDISDDDDREAIELIQIIFSFLEGKTNE